MAEALPRYQRAGVLLADIPRIDFGDRRESARSLSSLDERLGQLSQWALGEAVDRAKEEGLQYGAENPVTLRQLKDAEDAGRTPAELFAKRGTVYGDAARSMQAVSITADIELDVQERVNRLKLGLERGEVDIFKARDELKAMIDGSSKALVGIDPKASLKLRASLGALGNSAMLSMTQTYLKREDERKRVAIDDWISNVVPEQVRMHFDAGDTADPETGRVITPQQRIVAILHSTLREQLAGMPDEFARQADKRFADVLSRARINAVSAFVTRDDFILGDPAAALTRIRSGNMGQYSGTYQAMPESEREAVRKNFMEEIGRVHTLTERSTKQAEDAAKRNVYDSLARYWSMRDGPQKDALKNEIVASGRGVLSFDQLKSLLKPAGEGEKENVSLEIRAIDLVRRGGVTDLAEVQRRVPGLQPKQLKRLQDSIYDGGDRQLRDGVRNLAGIPDGLVQVNGDQQRRYAALTSEMERLKAEEIEKNTKAGYTGMYNPATVLGKLREAKDRITADKTVEQARTALEGYGNTKRARITESTSERQLKDLGFSAAEITDIRKRQRVIRGD